MFRWSSKSSLNSLCHSFLSKNKLLDGGSWCSKSLLNQKFYSNITFARSLGKNLIIAWINEFCKDSFIFNNIEVYEPYRFRPYCHVKDFARAIFKVYRAKHDLISSEIFNCGNQKNNFTKSKICKILKTFNKNLKIKLNNNIVDKRNYRVSFSKIEKKLSFKCLYSVEYGVREILGYLKKNKKVDYKKLGNYIIH